MSAPCYPCTRPTRRRTAQRLPRVRLLPRSAASRTPPRRRPAAHARRPQSPRLVKSPPSLRHSFTDPMQSGDTRGSETRRVSCDRIGLIPEFTRGAGRALLLHSACRWKCACRMNRRSAIGTLSSVPTLPGVSTTAAGSCACLEVSTLGER